jgi:hypothetical protein
MGVLAKRSGKIFSIFAASGLLRGLMKLTRFAVAAAVMLITHCANIQKEDTGANSAKNNNSGSGLANVAAGIYLADTVTEAPGNTGSGTYNASGIIDGVRGAGTAAGATSGVFSLDNSGASSHVVVRWAGKKIKNGTGIDFIVFENAFYVSGSSAARFMDLAFVEVSNDNVNYCGFAPDYTNAPETTYSNNPAHWPRFAGKTPVLYNLDTNNLSATQLFQDNDANKEPDLAGGDAFDLDDLSASNAYGNGCTTILRDELKTNGFIYLKLIPAARRINPDTGAAFVVDGVSTGPDFDGIAARYIE